MPAERAERPGSPVLLYKAGADGGQRTVVLDGSNAGVEAFGRRADGAARVVAEDGRLLIRPDGFLLADLASVVVFADERVGVTDLRTRNVPGGYSVRVRRRLR